MRKTAWRKEAWVLVSCERRISTWTRQWAKQDLFKSETSCHSSQEQPAARLPERQTPETLTAKCFQHNSREREQQPIIEELGQKAWAAALSPLLMVKQKAIWGVAQVTFFHSHDKLKAQNSGITIPCYSKDKTGKSESWNQHFDLAKGNFWGEA